MSQPSDINLAPTTKLSKFSLLDMLYIWGATAGKTLIIITNFIIISVWLYRWNLDRQIYNIATSVEEKQLAITSINKKEQTIRKIQTKLNILRNIENNKTYYSNLLSNFNKTIINGVTINRITFPSDKTINVSASAENGNIFGRYIDQLIKDSKIEEVTLFGSSFESNTKSYTFVLELKYQ